MTHASNADDHFRENIDRFSSDDLIDEYSERATSGLFPEERKAIDRHFTASHGTVLDVGCGAGRTTKPLAEMGFDVVGIDLSEEMIRAARAIFPELDFRVSDATALEYPSDEFDYVLFSHNGIDYIHPESKRRQALEELRRVLRPDGILVFSTHNSWYRFPALVSDHEFLRTFYLAERNRDRLLDQYKIDVGEANLYTYMSNPIRQRKQLRAAGFTPIEVVGKRTGPLKYFEAMLYFAARA